MTINEYEKIKESPGQAYFSFIFYIAGRGQGLYVIRPAINKRLQKKSNTLCGDSRQCVSTHLRMNTGCHTTCTSSILFPFFSLSGQFSVPLIFYMLAWHRKREKEIRTCLRPVSSLTVMLVHLHEAAERWPQAGFHPLRCTSIHTVNRDLAAVIPFYFSSFISFPVRPRCHRRILGHREKNMKMKRSTPYFLLLLY